MTGIVFCDVEGTLLLDSFPRLVLREARAMGRLSLAQNLQVAALGGIAAPFRGRFLGRRLQTLAMVRSIAGSRVEVVDQVLDKALPHVLAACKPEMLARLEMHRRDGYELVLLSAGLHAGIVKLAQALGGQGEGTHLLIRAGRYTGRTAGGVCQGLSKAARALEVARERGADPADCLAYGDTASDIPFLSLIGHPVAVDPDMSLRSYASQRGWPVLLSTADGRQSSGSAALSESAKNGEGESADEGQPEPAAVEGAQAVPAARADDVEHAAQSALIAFVTPRRTELRPREVGVLQTGFPLVFSNGLVGTRWGAGPTVLLVHGWEGRGTSLMVFIQPLVDRGFQVVALDGPGHGESPGETTDPMDFALHLTQVGQDLGPLAGIVAHSMGAASAALAIRRGLEVEKVVLLAGPSSLFGVLERYVQLTGLPEPVAQRFYALMAERVGAPRDAMTVAQVCRDFTVPALIFHDPEDAEVPFSDALEVAAAWPGARLRVVTGPGHRRILFAPEVVEEAADFLTGARVEV
jgi:HAD superfamily phosphoserine phosphatase-like hydrolase